MPTRRTLLKSAPALLALSLAGPVAAQSTEPTRVVATFSILGDMVQRIGGDHIALTTLGVAIGADQGRVAGCRGLGGMAGAIHGDAKPGHHGDHAIPVDVIADAADQRHAAAEAGKRFRDVARHAAEGGGQRDGI